MVLVPLAAAIQLQHQDRDHPRRASTAEPARLRHGYDEELTAEIWGSRLEEILAEKLRTLLQTRQKLIWSGWNRPRARNYYDLWRIPMGFGPALDHAVLPSLLARKCANLRSGELRSGNGRAHWRALPLGMRQEQSSGMETIETVVETLPCGNPGTAEVPTVHGSTGS